MIGEADIADDGQEDLQEVLRLVLGVFLVADAGQRHPGPGIAVEAAAVVGAAGGGGQAEARLGLAEAVFLEVDEALDGFGVHGVEGVLGAAELGAGLVEVFERGVGGAEHREGVGHAVGQHRAAVARGAGRAVERLAADFGGAAEIVAHGADHGADRKGLGPHLAGLGLEPVGVEHGGGFARAAGEAIGPGLHQAEAGFVGDAVVGQHVEPAGQQADAALFEAGLADLAHQREDAVDGFCLDPVVDGGHGAVVGEVPFHGSGMEAG